MRIVVIGDSLCLPRITENEVVSWEHTWPFLLEKQLKLQEPNNVELINCGKRKRTVDSLVSFDFTEHIVFKEPDLLIIQIGIVDGAPRIISKKERRLFNNRFFPRLVRNRIIKNRKKKKKIILRRNSLAKVYTKPKSFKTYLEEFKNKLDRHNYLLKNVIFIPIVANFDHMESVSPGYKHNIDIYNKILSNFSKRTNALILEELQLELCKADLFCKDGYHLNKDGHQFLTQSLINKLKNEETN